jgi:hypothetical protein
MFVQRRREFKVEIPVIDSPTPVPVILPRHHITSHHLTSSLHFFNTPFLYLHTHHRNIPILGCIMSSPTKEIDPSVPAAAEDIGNKNVSIEDQTLLLLARLMEGGQEDVDTCRDLSSLTKLLNEDAHGKIKTPEPHTPLFELIDIDSVETILGYLDMRQEKAVRGYATLTTSEYLKVSGDKGVQYLSDFFYSRVGKGTYDDFILAFSVAASIFPVVPDVIADLFLSEGFVPSLGPLMKRKWKSKKVEQAALEMLNAACMNTPCREAIKKYCTEWLDEIVHDVPQSHVEVSSPDRHHAAEDGSIQQRIHSEQVRNLAAVVLAKIQVGLSPFSTVPFVPSCHLSPQIQALGVF